MSPCPNVSMSPPPLSCKCQTPKVGVVDASCAHVRMPRCPHVPAPCPLSVKPWRCESCWWNAVLVLGPHAPMSPCPPPCPPHRCRCHSLQKAPATRFRGEASMSFIVVYSVRFSKKIVEIRSFSPFTWRPIEQEKQMIAQNVKVSAKGQALGLLVRQVSSPKGVRGVHVSKASNVQVIQKPMSKWAAASA